MALCMGIAAAGAQATPVFEAGSYTATVRGETSTFVIGTEGGNIECQTTSFHGTLAAASSSLVVQPAISSCIAWGFINLTVNNQSCGYLLRATEKQATDEYKAHFDVTCPGSGGFLYSAGTCSMEIPPQEGRTSVDIDDATGSPNRVNTTLEVGSLTYVVTKDGFGCPFKGTGTKTDGTLTSGTFPMKAFKLNNLTEEIGLLVSGA